jgi:hypothetical protein
MNRSTGWTTAAPPAGHTEGRRGRMYSSCGDDVAASERWYLQSIMCGIERERWCYYKREVQHQRCMRMVRYQDARNNVPWIAQLCSNRAVVTGRLLRVLLVVDRSRGATTIMPGLAQASQSPWRRARAPGRAPAPRRSGLVTCGPPVRPAIARPWFRFGGRCLLRRAPA